MQLLVFTDLDGSLLDHHDYSYREALPALDRLRCRCIPLVFVTSKTRAEVELLQRELELEEPFVVENGGGIFFPHRYDDFAIPGGEPAGDCRVVVLGRRYDEIRDFIDGVRSRFGIRGFGDMDDAEVARIAGLPEEAAALARRRDFTEPFLIDDPAGVPELAELAHVAGLAVTRGGRFHHLIGAEQDKGEAVRRVRQLFEANGRREIVTVGIGDSPNDLPMLAVVDLPVVIPNPDAGPIDPDRPELRVAAHPGSRGWNRVVLELLERFPDGGEP